MSGLVAASKDATVIVFDNDLVESVLMNGCRSDPLQARFAGIEMKV
jgi:hypothetical protein